MAERDAAHNRHMQTNPRQRRDRLGISQSDLAQLADVELADDLTFTKSTRWYVEMMSERGRLTINQEGVRSPEAAHNANEAPTNP